MKQGLFMRDDTGDCVHTWDRVRFILTPVDDSGICCQRTAIVTDPDIRAEVYSYGPRMCRGWRVRQRASIRSISTHLGLELISIEDVHNSTCTRILTWGKRIRGKLTTVGRTDLLVSKASCRCTR